MDYKYLRKKCAEGHDIPSGSYRCSTCGGSDARRRCPYESLSDHVYLYRCLPKCTSIAIYVDDVEIHRVVPNIILYTYNDLKKVLPSDIVIPYPLDHIFLYPREMSTYNHILVFEYGTPTVYDCLSSLDLKVYYRYLYPDIVQRYSDIPELHLKPHGLDKDIATQIVNHYQYIDSPNEDIRCCTIQ